MSAGGYRLGVIRIRKCRNPDIRNQVALDGSEGAVVRSETYAVIVIQIVRDSAYLSIGVREEETAGVNYSPRSPKGNRQMRRILNQCANAAVKHKGSNFEILYRRLVPRLGHNKTIGAIAHRLCRLIWIILHKGVRYEERGPAVSEKSRRARTVRMIRTLRNLGYRVEPLGNPA